MWEDQEKEIKYRDDVNKEEPADRRIGGERFLKESRTDAVETPRGREAMQDHKIFVLEAIDGELAKGAKKN